MKTTGLPHSDNVEDRRGEKPSLGPRFTLAELVQRGEAVAFKAEPESKLAKDAGAEDISKGERDG